MSYPNSHVFLICFSILSRDSFKHVVSDYFFVNKDQKEKWYKELCENVTSLKEVAIILVGLKSDLRDSNSVQPQEAQQLVKELGFCEYIECSAKTRDNVQFVFDQAVHHVFENKKHVSGKKNEKCILS